VRPALAIGERIQGDCARAKSCIFFTADGRKRIDL